MIDPHCHFLDPVANPDQHSTLVKSNLGLETYLPENYIRDFEGLGVEKIVHLEVLPDDFVEEVRWVHKMYTDGRCPFLGGIVAAADPSKHEFEDVLQQCLDASSMLKGIRWILNWDGELKPNETATIDRATWPRVKKSNYFIDPIFSSNFHLLEKYELSFDLQCNPNQLKDAAKFFVQFPNIPVVLDHIGSLKLNGNDYHDQFEIELWKKGLDDLSSLPNMFVKLSMFNYTLNDWHREIKKQNILRNLIHDVIKIFGSSRCMFASNFPVDRDLQNGITAKTIYNHYHSWTTDLSAEDKLNLFHKTASNFYRI